MAELRVSCTPSEDGWNCHVTVDEGGSRTEHQVSLTADDLRRYGGESAAPEGLVEESFRFLLKREPKEAILGRFELPVIGRYFPEYEAAIRRRL